MGARVIGVEFDGLFRKASRLNLGLSVIKRQRIGTQNAVICSKVRGMLSCGSLKVSSFDSASECCYDRLNKLILKVENLFDWTIKSIRPYMMFCRGIDQLSSNAKAVP